MTGPWSNNQMYKCYLLEFDPLPIEKLNHDYVSFRKKCIPQKNEISPEFLKNYQEDLKKDLNHVENRINGWMQKIVQLLKLNYFQDYNEETNNVLVNRVKRQTQILLDTKGLGEAVHSIGNFVAHMYHYTRNRKLQAQINDMSHFMLDLTNNYETFQMETVDFEQKNLFLHSLNRIYAKGNLFFMNICQQLQRTYDGIFELIKGTISQQFISFKTAVKLYETLKKKAEKYDLELSYSNIAGLYSSDFKTNWHTIGNSSFLKVQLQTPTIDKKHEFYLHELMNFPIKIKDEFYILDTEETFFAINDGYWFNLTNGMDFLSHQNRTVDDRNYTTFTSQEFHGKCQFKPETGYFCQGFDIHSTRRNRCLSNIYFGYMENCRFKKYSGDKIYVKRSLNGETTEITTKSYGCIFSDYYSRCCHIELLPDGSTDSFFHGYKRFCCRRGEPNEIFSDCAQVFVKSAKELKRIWSLPKNLRMSADLKKVISNYDWNRIETEVEKRGTRWRHNIPKMSWAAGLVERNIGLVKSALMNTVRKSKLSYQSMFTLVCEAECLVNLRPLGVLGSEGITVTPSELAIGRNTNLVPDDGKIDFSKPLSRKMYEQKKLTNSFFRRWQQDYLQNLAVSRIWKKDYPNILKIGMHVLVRDNDLSKNQWMTGIITDLIRSNDGRIRSCVLKNTKGNTIYRPTSKISIFEHSLLEDYNEADSPNLD